MSSYGHRVRKIAEDHYRLSWTVDFHYAGSRLRFPRVFTKDTDKAGAERFAARWNTPIRGEADEVRPAARPARSTGFRRRA